MKIYPLDIAVIIWGVAGTFLLNGLLQLQVRHECERSFVVATAVVLSLVPLVVMRMQVVEYSAVGIIATTLTIFWFAVLASWSCRVRR